MMESPGLERVIFGVMIIAGIVAAAGCTNASLALYPEFPAQKSSMGRSMLLSDYVTIDATMGDTNIVDIAGNKQMAVALMDEVSDLLNGKGFHIENRLLSSMGLFMNKKTTAKVIGTIEEKDFDVNRLALKHPPFYIYRVFENDTLKQLLESFYTALVNSSKVKGQPNRVVPEAVPLGNTIGGGTWFVLLTGGYNMPVGKEFSDMNPAESVTLETSGARPISQVTMMLFVVNTETGELLWSDMRHEMGGTIHKERIMRIAEMIISFLP